MKLFRLLFCLSALCLLAVGCAANRTAALTPVRPCEVGAQQCATTDPGWTVTLPGDRL